MLPLIASILATSAAAGFHYHGARQQNASAKQMSREQIDFQERMSNTAHQREVADLAAAGLNPILSAKYGGSSTPGGAMAQVVNPFDGIGNSVNSAFDHRHKSAERELMAKQIANLDSQILKTGADTSTALSQARLNAALIQKVKAETNLTSNSALNVGVNNALLRAAVPAAVNEAKYQQDVGKWAPWARNSLNFLKDIFGTAHSAKSLSSKR